MFPEICRIGPFSIYSFGILLALSAIICTYLLSKEAHKLNIEKDAIVDFVFWVVVSGILGARVFFIFLNIGDFIDEPLNIIMLHHGGLAWQGSLIAGILVGILYIYRKRWPLIAMLDLVAPYIALGQAIGRIGCFLNGCCYGKPVSWGIFFPLRNARLIPTQLFSSLGLFIVFLILKKSQIGKAYNGLIFVRYLYLAGLLRFVIEFFRGDHSVTVYGLSIFQFVSLGLIVFGLALSHVFKNMNKKNHV